MNRYIAGLTQVSTALGISLGCYLVSAQVAAERAGVAQLRVEIARDAEAMRALDAELHTRARLPQLQSWNDSALLMSAPAPQQMLAAPAQLVAYLPGGGGRAAPIEAVARTRADVPAPLPLAQPAQPAPAPIMAAQVAMRAHAPPVLLADARPYADARPAETTPGRDRARATVADPIAEIAQRAPVADRGGDVADLTSAIGRELKVADAPARRVSLR